MKRIRTAFAGVDQGTVSLFSEFEDGGDMWTGEGSRERRSWVDFSETYEEAPSVTLAVSLWDVDSSANLRSDLRAENVQPHGFEIVLETWGDTKIARISVSWLAIGELPDEDKWNVPD